MLTDPRKNNQPFYIGKGQKNRAYVHAYEKAKYNQFKQNVVNAIRKKGMQHGVDILKEFAEEKDALNYEIELIKKYGRRRLDVGGILSNRSLGGEGISGYKFTDKQKKKLSESHLGIRDSAETKRRKSESAKKPKSKDHAINISKAKLGDKNPMYGKISHRKGKSYEEEYGPAKAAELKSIIRDKRALQIDSEETRAKKSASAKLAHQRRKQNLLK